MFSLDTWATSSEVSSGPMHPTSGESQARSMLVVAYPREGQTHRKTGAMPVVSSGLVHTARAAQSPWFSGVVSEG